MAPSSKFKLAAGGLVERTLPGGIHLAVVRRTRYGDWVLPKGKPDDDESIEQTALREVMEETGCHARIVGHGILHRIPRGKGDEGRDLLSHGVCLGRVCDRSR